MRILIITILALLYKIQPNLALGVNNFKGQPPAGSYQSAHTVAQYDYVFKGKGDKMNLSIECWILQDSSWINWSKPELKSQQVLKDLLKHEQGHFDVALLMAKRLRKSVGTVNFGNPNTEVLRLKKVRQQNNLEGKRLSDQYESETQNGMNKEAQLRWDNFLHQQLRELEHEQVVVYFK